MYKQLATSIMLLAVWMVPQSASAAKMCKPTLAVSAKTASAAKHKWGLEAAAKHGAKYAFLGKAKDVKVSPRISISGGQPVRRMRVSAKPCIKKSICRGTVKAKGMFYTKRSKAVSSAQGRWEFAAAAKYGALFAHWKRVKGKSMRCTGGHGPKGNLYNCKARAKACI